jgi:hypothetical protein
MESGPKSKRGLSKPLDERKPFPSARIDPQRINSAALQFRGQLVRLEGAGSWLVINRVNRSVAAAARENPNLGQGDCRLINGDWASIR